MSETLMNLRRIANEQVTVSRSHLLCAIEMLASDVEAGQVGAESMRLVIQAQREYRQDLATWNRVSAMISEAM